MSVPVLLITSIAWYKGLPIYIRTIKRHSEPLDRDKEYYHNIDVDYNQTSLNTCFVIHIIPYNPDSVSGNIFYHFLFKMFQLYYIFTIHKTQISNYDSQSEQFVKGGQNDRPI